MWLILRVRHDKNGKFWPMIKRREKKDNRKLTDKPDVKV